MAGSVQNGISEGHAAAVLVNAGKSNFCALNLTNRIARDEGGRVAVWAQTQVGQIDHRWVSTKTLHKRSVILTTLLQIFPFDWHGVDLVLWNGSVGEQTRAKMSEVAVRVTSGSDALVNLNDVHLGPWHILVGKRA
jgi:hypothetical protein